MAKAGFLERDHERLLRIGFDVRRDACTFPILAGPDCVNMTEFTELCDALLAPGATVRRYETSFIKRDVKFEPFVNLGEES